MFILLGRPLALDVAFTDAAGIERPANWLRLASPEERLAAGITEQPDPIPYDERFYWGRREDGSLIPKDHGDLVVLWQNTTRQTANTLLTPTDWQIIRESDNGTPVLSGVKEYRQSIREATGVKNAAISGTTTTEALADYITGQDYPVWPTLG
jgi:hypothetical protein